MRSTLVAAAVIGGSALALTASLPASAMPVAQIKQVSQVETIGYCHRRWRRHAWYHSYGWSGGYSGTLLYFGPHYKYADRKAGW